MQLTRTAPGAPLSEGVKALALVSFAALVAARFFPFEKLPSVCGLRNATGYPCPGCGMTRSFIRVVHGDLSAALHVSPLGTVLAFGAVFVVLYALARLTLLRRGFSLQLSRREKRGAAVALFAVLGANWLYLLLSGAATG